ncbi:MAG TPA: type II toxin-antitoxin system RelE/ParE family toxin [Terriglobia bacterium]
MLSRRFIGDHCSRILKKIAALPSHPRPSGMTQLATSGDPVYRIRIGDYRVIYEVHDEGALSHE